MKIRAWIAFCFTVFLVCHTLVAEAVGVHSSMSKRVIKETGKLYGPDAARRVVLWNELVVNNADKPVAVKLELVNNFFNRIPVASEIEIWKHEHWSTPYEMLAKNVGSHADHAIGKYVTLEGMGIPVEQMHLTHVHSVESPSQSHVVLTYHPTRKAMPLVLDSLRSDIKPADERKDLVPEHSLNDFAAWLSKEQFDGRDDASEEANMHIELWHEMNFRMDRELLSVEDLETLQ